MASGTIGSGRSSRLLTLLFRSGSLLTTQGRLQRQFRAFKLIVRSVREGESGPGLRSKPVFDRPDRDLRAALETELCEDAGHMDVDCSLTEYTSSEAPHRLTKRH